MILASASHNGRANCGNPDPPILETNATSVSRAIKTTMFIIVAGCMASVTVCKHLPLQDDYVDPFSSTCMHVVKNQLI